MNNIELCKKCKKRKLDLKQGIICSLTNEKPTFEDNCSNFENDKTIKEFKGHAIKPNEQRAKNALLFIWIILGLEIVSLISGGMQYVLINDILNGVEVDIEKVNSNDFREIVIGLIYLIVYIISGIAFIHWFRRAYFNLHQKVENLSFGEGWAAGGWFVPIVNFFRPYQIMKEIYQKTENILVNKGVFEKYSLSTNYLRVWWTLWIINGLIGQIYFRYPSETIENVLVETIIGMIMSIVGIPLALVTIKIIKDYSMLESLLKE